MNQPNRVVQTIINNIIERSRSNSLTLDSNIKPNQLIVDYSQQEQEFVIKLRDLRLFIQKMAEQNLQNQLTIERKQIQISNLNDKIIKYQKKISFIIESDNAKSIHLMNKDQHYQKCIKDLENKLQAQRKSRETNQKQLKWTNHKVREQLRQIQYLKQSDSKKNHLIQQLTQSIQKQNIQENQSRLENSLPQTIEERQSQNYTTPKSQIKQIVSSNISDESNTEQRLHLGKIYNYKSINSVQKQIQTQQTNICQADPGQQSQSVKGFKLRQSEVVNTFGISRMHRHSQVDLQNKIIKLLAQKCLKLEEHIQKLLKRLVGDRIEVSEQNKNNLEQEQKYRTNQQQKTISRKMSDIEMSSAFKVQSQQI